MTDESWGEIALKIIEAIGVKKLLAYVLERKHFIIVVGSTGAGKTALVGALQSVEQQIVKVLNRTETPVQKKVSIDSISTVLVDTPGEIAKIRTKMSDISRLFHKPRVGIILVVADGYHEYNSSSVADIDTPEKLNDYLERHRANEINFFQQFASQFPFVDRVDWALTVATKADLWWKDSDRVLNSYRSEDFQNITRKICRHGAPPRPFSSSIEPFLGIIPGYQGFGEVKRREVREDFLHTFIEQMVNN